MQEYKGFYYDGENYIYADITDKVIHIFGEGIISKVLYEIEYYYGYDLDINKKESFEEFIDRQYENIYNRLNELEFIKEIDIGGISIIIEFITGFSIKIDSSEWGSIQKY